LTALFANLVLTQLPAFSMDVDGLARAFTISFVIGPAAAATLALRLRAIYPALRDLTTGAAATAVMGFAIQPINAIHPPILAAVLALTVGGSILAAAMLGFDVGGCRAYVARLARSPVFPADGRRRG
jgi:hypothetical protein